MTQAPLPKTPTAAAAARMQAELPQTLGECHEVIDQLRSQVGQLQEHVMTLQERLKLDSSNSSKPPSSDGPGSGNRAQRRASTRNREAQKGHKGHSRACTYSRVRRAYFDYKSSQSLPDDVQLS